MILKIKFELLNFLEIMKIPSELRLDPVSKDWIVIATGRAKRPHHFKKGEKDNLIDLGEKECPFCHIEIQKKTILAYLYGKKIEFKIDKKKMRFLKTV